MVDGAGHVGRAVARGGEAQRPLAGGRPMDVAQADARQRLDFARAAQFAAPGHEQIAREMIGHDDVGNLCAAGAAGLARAVSSAAPSAASAGRHA